MNPHGNTAILVVDDEAVVRDMIHQFLKARGYRVFLAESGKEAVAVMVDEPIEIVITDLVMPGMNGLELLASRH